MIPRTGAHIHDPSRDHQAPYNPSNVLVLLTPQGPSGQDTGASNPLVCDISLRKLLICTIFVGGNGGGRDRGVRISSKAAPGGYKDQIYS